MKNDEEKKNNACVAIFDPEGVMIEVATDSELAIARVVAKKGKLWHTLWLQGYSVFDGEFAMTDGLAQVFNNSCERAEEKLKRTVAAREKEQEKAIRESNFRF